MRKLASFRTLGALTALTLLLLSGSVLVNVTAAQAAGTLCSDGIDNDGDGAVDFPAEFGCSSAADNDETYPESQCQDRADNDHDGFTDLGDSGCVSSQDNDESGPAGRAQCSDGLDNDGDGSTDFPYDYSCSSKDDTDESWPRPQCQDGYDNDNDRLVDYPQEPGCTSLQDNSEQVFSTERAQCSDGIDNDGDGSTDYPNDYSCSAPNDNDERFPVAACQDGYDNNQDGKTDYPNDLSCTSPQDITEDNANRTVTHCNDGIDNDGDGASDFPYDYSCSSREDTDEEGPQTQCQDKKDNDGDGLADYPKDPGCASLQDNDEGNTDGTPQCRDGIDNDGDGGVDHPGDLGCFSGDDVNESDSQAKCQDGMDNDNDGLADYPQDPGCSAPQDNNEKNVGSVTIDITANPDPVKPGEQVRYTITLRNMSSSGQADIRLQQNLPPGMHFVTATDGGYNRFDGLVYWSRVSVSGYAVKSLSMTASTDSTLQNGDTLESLLYANGEVVARVASKIRTDAPAVTSYQGNVSGYAGQTGMYQQAVQTVNQTTTMAANQYVAMGTQILPQTGIEDFTSPLENTRRFLTPVTGSEAAGPVAALIWSALVLAGLGLGSACTRKVFI